MTELIHGSTNGSSPDARGSQAPAPSASPTEKLLARLQCVECHSRSFGVEATSSSAFEIACQNCRRRMTYREGILYCLPAPEADPHQVDPWDRTYTRPIRGNFNRRGQDLYSQLLEVLAMADWQRFYPLISLMTAQTAHYETSIEIGSGTGSCSFLLASQGIVGTPFLAETNLNALLISRRLFQQAGLPCHFVLADGRRLPFADDAFSMSFSGGLLEHFPSGPLAQLVGEHARVAQLIACQAPISTPAYWFVRVVLTVLNRGWPFGKEIPLTRRKVEALFREAGARLVRADYQDPLTSVLKRVRSRLRLPVPIRRTVLNRLLRTDGVYLAKRLPRQKPPQRMAGTAARVS